MSEAKQRVAVICRETENGKLKLKCALFGNGRAVKGGTLSRPALSCAIYL